MRRIGHRLLAASLGAFGVFAGAMADPVEALERDTVSVQGSERAFFVDVPADTSARRSIVLVLHGGLVGRLSRNARAVEGFAQSTMFPQYAAGEGYIAVYPVTEGRGWNDGRTAMGSQFDDVAYLKAVIEKVADAYGGDPQRAFVAGVSSGGMMAMRLACEASNSFAAYAVVAAHMPMDIADRCRPSGATPMIFLNGTADPIIPPPGQSSEGQGVASRDDTATFWARANGCGQAATLDVPDRADDGTRVVVHDYQGCSVLDYEIEGGGHSWPGVKTSERRQQRAGATSRDIDGTATIVQFFKQHGL